jgi:hypothetical protein
VAVATFAVYGNRRRDQLGAPLRTPFVLGNAAIRPGGLFSHIKLPLEM